jgi:hypothetical protein
LHARGSQRGIVIRNCLIEAGQPEDGVTTLDFARLIGAGRKHFGWQVPKHYTTKETTRLLRNAVMFLAAVSDSLRRSCVCAASDRSGAQGLPDLLHHLVHRQHLGEQEA